jgi:DNA-binding NarL/FixJ family response regulator
MRLLSCFLFTLTVTGSLRHYAQVPVGYLQKDTPLQEVIDAIHIVHKGGSAMSPAIARKVMEYFSPKRTYNEAITAKETPGSNRRWWMELEL